MVEPKSYNVWGFTPYKEFEAHSEIQKERICILCKKILINGSNGICGCTYCVECLTNYMGNDERLCPWEQLFCKNQIMSTNLRMQIEQEITKRIIELAVKCPRQSCDPCRESEELVDHVRLCTPSNVSCPYRNACCNTSNIVQQNTNEQLIFENTVQSKMLAKSVEHLSNQIDLLKKENSLLKMHVKTFKEEKEQETKKEERNERKDIGKETESFQNKVPDNIDENEISKQKVDSKNLLTLARESWNKKHKRPLSFKWKVHHKKHNSGEFVWVIENFSDRRIDQKNGMITSIASQPFYAYQNGYRMCLTVHPDGVLDGIGTHLSVGFCILRGHFDASLEWPFRHDVTLALINQKTGKVHHSRTKKYNELEVEIERKRPTTDKHVGIGFPQYIKLNHLLNDTALWHKDRIILRCVVIIHK